MERLADRAAQAPDEAVLALIEQAAEETLTVWPEAKAAVLFGSRARGDHRSDSDWDVAFLTADGVQLEAVPEGLPIRSLDPGIDVQCLALPVPLARRKARAIGHVALGVLRDGLLLAGAWPACGRNLEDPLSMQPDEYSRLVYDALDHMKHAALAAFGLGGSGQWRDDLAACDSFAAASADAAELLAKAMLGRQGVEYPKTHELKRLARTARQAGLGAMADDILSMDGQTKKHHEAPYGGVTARGCAHAVGRFLAMVPVLGGEIAAAHDPPFASVSVDSRASAVFKARECLAALRETAGRASTAETAPEAFLGETIAVLAAARPALAGVLEELAAGLSSEEQPDPAETTDIPQP